MRHQILHIHIYSVATRSGEPHNALHSSSNYSQARISALALMQQHMHHIGCMDERYIPTLMGRGSEVYIDGRFTHLRAGIADRTEQTEYNALSQLLPSCALFTHYARAINFVHLQIIMM